MRIAFYAPMKPLDDPVPSGDRQMGRLIVQALEATGHDVSIASRLRTWSREGGPEQQEQKIAATAEAERIIRNWRAADPRPDLFLTYHLYHKAPDWIGPAVADAFGLPYLVIEASRAAKRARGPFAFGLAEADRALERADGVVALHAEDAEGLATVVQPDRLFQMAPFIDTRPFRINSAQSVRSGGPIRLLTVAMMRRGDKERSYRVLAEALRMLGPRDYVHTIVGDGAARADLEPLFQPDRTRWIGEKTATDLPALYAHADLFVWPAINEAFGLVFLEAQAAGVPVVAGSTGGVPDIVRDGVTGRLAPEGDAAAFAYAVAAFLDHPDDLGLFGAAARDSVETHHSLEAGVQALQPVVDRVTRDVPAGKSRHAHGHTGPDRRTPST